MTLDSCFLLCAVQIGVEVWVNMKMKQSHCHIFVIAYHKNYDWHPFSPSLSRPFFSIA